MEMSNALQKNLMQLFPNKIIYSAELCKNISVHMALHREAKRAGVSSRQLTESNGFVWKDIERAMDFSGEKVDESLEVVPVINQIYTTQTFLGNAILTEEQRIAVYSYAKSAFDKRFVEGKGLSITEEKAIILETIFALQGRSADDDESQSKIWVFVFKHFCGYTLGQGTTEYQHYYRFFCKAIDKVMRLTNHFLVPTEKNGIRYQGYYDTLLIHALEPADAANRFFSILFDFYVNTLDCQYIPGDPAFKPLVKAIKAKWNDNFDSEVDVRSAVVSASFKTLLELCQGYACVFCEDIIHKMDVITSGYGIDEQLDTKHFRLDLLIYRWFQQQSRGQRKQAQDSRKNHRNDRVAIHRSDIHASYELIDGIAYIVLPKIRFEESDCQLIANGNRPQVIISLDGKEIYTEPMKIFGSQVFTSREYRFLLNQVQGANLHFSVKVIIGDNNHVIYDSHKTLYRDYLILSRNMGHEIRNIQKTADGAAYLFTPLESDVDFDEDSGDIYTVECDFAQKFALDVNALHCLTVNGIELYADASTKSRVRVKVRPERIPSAFALSENAMYTVHSRIEAVDVELPEEEKIEKYQIQLDGKTVPLAAYLQEKDFYLPIIGESGSHSIRIFDLASGKNACVYDYFVIPEFTYSLNYPIFFDEGKTVTVQTFDAHYGHREFTIYSEPGNNTIQIPAFTAMATLQLSLPVVHATLLQSDQHRNLFTLENKDLWVDDLKADSFISIDCPKGWVAKFFMGNDELVCSKSNHLYEIGNFLQMHKGTDSNANLFVRLERGMNKPVFYNLLTVHFKPSFNRCPLIYENGALYWEIEDMLRDHLNQQYKSGLLKKDFENVDFMTISALAYKVAGDMNGLEDLEQWLSDCYDKKEVFGYKHVIVDEGQDFGLLGVDDSANEDSSYGCQIIDILELVALGNGGTFYLFCDRNQIVQGAGADAQLPACISDSECKLTLHRNCRNTYEIATTSIKPLPKNDRNITAKQGPKSGIKPHMYAIANSDEQIEYINKAIDSLKDTCESITILSVKNTLNNSILSPYTECESVGDYSRHYTHKGKECLFSNCSKFKGLEADAIILIDVDSSTFDKGAMYFYVGASRARRNLEIISNATKEDCALMVRSLNPKAPLRRDPISMLKVLLSCDVDLIE